MTGITWIHIAGGTLALLGQQDVRAGRALRGAPILFVLAFAPSALMHFWLVCVQFPGTRALKPQPSPPIEE